MKNAYHSWKWPNPSYPLIVFFSIFLIYSPIYFGHFAYHNDYRIWEYDHQQCCFGYPESIHLLAIGRPIGALLLNVQLMFIHTIHAVWINQLVSVLLIALLAVGYFLFFKTYLKISRAAAALMSGLIMTLPSMSINAAWITNLVPTLIPLFLVLFAQAMFEKKLILADQPQRMSTFLYFSEIVGVLFVSLLIYPPATFFFITLTFIKYLFGRSTYPAALNFKHLFLEIGLLCIACLLFFATVKLILKPFYIHTQFVGIDWLQFYKEFNLTHPEYHFGLHLKLSEKWNQCKDYLQLVFSAWFPLLPWKLIYLNLTLFIAGLFYASHTQASPQSIRHHLLFLATSLSLSLMTTLPILLGPAIYQINYRATFASMALVPAVLVFLVNRFFLSSHEQLERSPTQQRSIHIKWPFQQSFMLFLICGSIFLIAAVSLHRLSLLVTRGTEEYRRVKSTLSLNMNEQINEIRVQRPVAPEADPVWLTMDFGLTATDFGIAGIIQAALLELGKDPSTYHIVFGSKFSADKQQRALLIPKIILAPQHIITSQDLIGKWSISGRPTQITYLDNRLMLTNELNVSTPAKVEKNAYLYAENWNTAAILSQNGRELRWDNGTTWVRNE